MKKKHIIIFILSFITIMVFIIVRYGFFIILWFTTPNILEKSEQEKQLIEHFKIFFKVDNVAVEPKYDMKKDTVYSIFISKIPCKDTINSEKIAIYVKNKLDKVDLKSKFVRYKINLMYDCNTYHEKEYAFERNANR